MKVAMYKWAFIDDVLITVAGEGEVPDAQWDAFVRDMRQKPFSKFLAAGLGELTVSSTRRKQINDYLVEKKIPVTLITDFRTIRGMATAASWFGINIKAFAWNEAQEAVKHLGGGDRVFSELLRLKAKVEQGTV